MATTAAGRVLAIRSTVTVRLVASRVGRDAAAVRELAAAAFVRVAFSAAVAAALVDDRWLAVAIMAPLAAPFTAVLRVSFCAVKLVLAATRTLLARTRRSFYRVTLARRSRATFTTAQRPVTPFYQTSFRSNSCEFDSSPGQISTSNNPGKLFTPVCGVVVVLWFNAPLDT